MAVVCVCPSVCPVCDAKLRTEGHRKLKIGTNKTYDTGHLEVKRSRSPGCLTQRPKIGLIFRMARPTNFKFGINDEVRWPTSTTCAVSDLKAVVGCSSHCLQGRCYIVAASLQAKQLIMCALYSDLVLLWVFKLLSPFSVFCSFWDCHFIFCRAWLDYPDTISYQSVCFIGVRLGRIYWHTMNTNHVIKIGVKIACQIAETSAFGAPLRSHQMPCPWTLLETFISQTPRPCSSTFKRSVMWPFVLYILGTPGMRCVSMQLWMLSDGNWANYKDPSVAVSSSYTFNLLYHLLFSIAVYYAVRCLWNVLNLDFPSVLWHGWVTGRCPTC